MEALDADDVRNDDGDEVVDPPDGWAAADRVAEEPDGESLDEKLAAEEPERPDEGEAAAATDDDTGLLSDDELDRVDSEDHGRDKGQIGGSPEDGDSMFPIVD
ncbi:MAG TPA: hypothetical protein VER34_11335 [Mycobacterium sp.]|nr:hypothetical protein [Mycobacterium sp.]